MTVELSGGASPSEVGGGASPSEVGRGTVPPRDVGSPQDLGSQAAVRSPFVLLGDADAEACGPDGCALPD